MQWRKDGNGRESKQVPRDTEDIREVTAGGRTFYLKRSGRKVTAHKSFADAKWDREAKDVYDIFTKKELVTLFTNAKLKSVDRRKNVDQ